PQSTMADEGNRAQALEKERERMMEDFKKQKEKIIKVGLLAMALLVDSEVRIGSDKFVTQSDQAQAELVKHTVGLVKLEDFKKIRANLDKKRQEEIERELSKS
ncbi:hypothetical protein HK405_009146, partial [Cladochytrium tenue]